MKQSVQKTIRGETARFYENIADSFDISRNAPWPGWTRVLAHMKVGENREMCAIADLGCGNGRFYAFLASHLTVSFGYTGYDASKTLLQKAKRRYPEAKFAQADVIETPEVLGKHYDIIAAFGLTHHIPGANARRAWFSEIAAHIAENGLFVVTFWQCDLDSRSKKLTRQHPDVSQDELEDGDHFLTWQDSGQLRYVHVYTPEERERITRDLNGFGMRLEDHFESDGRTGKTNLYHMYKKGNG